MTRKTPDPRVAHLLEELKLEYFLDHDADYRITFNIDETRSQMVTVESETREIGNLEVRGVWSIGLKSEVPLDAETATALLVHNGDSNLGAWQLITKPDDSCTAIFLCPVAIDAPAEDFRSVLHAVAVAADEMEAKLTGKDIF